MRTLTLPLKAEYFDAIRDGSKLEEYRLATPYWDQRLRSQDYDRVVLTKGYPKRDDASRRIARAWRGYTVRTLTHPHFGPDSVTVYAIDVSAPTPSEAGEK